MAKAKSTSARTDGQRLYDEVAKSESRIAEILDAIPYPMLRDRGAPGSDATDTCITLQEVARDLQEAVKLLEAVRKREAPRYSGK